MSLLNPLPENTVSPEMSMNPLRAFVSRWLNRGLAQDRRIELKIGWPLWLIPLLFLNQLIAPHRVWVVLIIALSGFYIVGYAWVRNQAPAVTFKRRRVGSILVAGDMLQEEFELSNSSALPVLWAEFVDASTVPDYQVGRVIACEGNNYYRWRSEVMCKQRGSYRLGPHQLRLQDPLGLFSVTLDSTTDDVVLIYPRVVHLPPVQLPRGNSQGGDRRRRPLWGNLPAATVSDYQHGDSLRFVHWASTARRGRMMVKDLEIEPGGSIWIVLDLYGRGHHGDGTTGTLEHSIIVAASLAANLLGGRDQRAVGLVAYSGGSTAKSEGEAKGGGEASSGLVEVLPAEGSAQTWPILSALAPVSAGDVDLATLLASGRSRIGRRSTMMVITPLVGTVGSLANNEVDAAANTGANIDWIAELIHLRDIGVASSVVLVAAKGDDPKRAEAMQAILARLDIPCTVMSADAPLSALLTFRRRRRVVRSTPTGGAVTYEVDEEVG